MIAALKNKLGNYNRFATRLPLSLDWLESGG
jgi:hypothetical protein